MRYVIIDVDIANGTLSLRNEEDARINLEEEEIQWQFVGLPNNYVGGIQFRVDDDSQSIRGPFACLRKTASQVFGTGRSGTAQKHYKAHVQLTAAAAQSKVETRKIEPLELELEVAESVQRPAPVILVGPGLVEDTLTVYPDNVGIYSGETVVWRFEGMKEEHWSPSVIFTSGPEDSDASPHGPFQSLTYANDIVIGSGNNKVVGEYTYEVAIVSNVTGENLRVRDDDPVVGNNGDPPGGG